MINCTSRGSGYGGIRLRCISATRVRSAEITVPTFGLDPRESRLTAVPAQLNVVLGVEDLAETRAFYEALGRRSRPREGMFARFQLGDADLVLLPVDKLAEVVGLPVVSGEGFRG